MAERVTDRPVVLLWAQARGGVIGHEGDMPWYLPEDLAHFKRETLGKPVVMGRGTWDALPDNARPLPGRLNIVVTSTPATVDGALTAASLPEALRLADEHDPGDGPIYVIGGGKLFEEAVEHASDLVVTHIDLDTPGDTFAPGVEGFTAHSDSGPQVSRNDALGYRIVRYRRPAHR